MNKKSFSDDTFSDRNLKNGASSVWQKFKKYKPKKVAVPNNSRGRLGKVI